MTKDRRDDLGRRRNRARWSLRQGRVGRDAGLGRPAASARAESAVVRIEGALIVSAGTGDTGVFERSLREIHETLLRLDS